MKRFEQPVRTLLVVAWSAALLTTIVAQVLFASTSDFTPVVLSAVALNLPPSVAIVAVRWPRSMALFAAASGRVFVGLWTTSIVSVVSALVVGGVLSLVTQSIDPLVGALLVALVIVFTHGIGLAVYLLVGEFFVALFLVSTARFRGAKAPIDRLAAGTLLLLVLVLAVAAVLSVPREPHLRGSALFFVALFRFDGTPLEQVYGWIARVALIGIAACVLWLFELRARAGKAKRLRRKMRKAEREA